MHFCAAVHLSFVSASNSSPDKIVFQALDVLALHSHIRLDFNEEFFCVVFVSIFQEQQFLDREKQIRRKLCVQRTRIKQSKVKYALRLRVTLLLLFSFCFVEIVVLEFSGDLLRMERDYV